jgi:hypothetical protein
MMPDYNMDYIKAGRVIDQIVEAQSPAELPEEPMPYDIHEVHLQVLRQFMQDEAYLALEPWQQQALKIRSMMHYQAMEERMLRQGAAPGTNTPVPGGGGHSEGGEKEKKGDYTTEDAVMEKETQGATHDVSSSVASQRAVGA